MKGGDGVKPASFGNTPVSSAARRRRRGDYHYVLPRGRYEADAG